MQLLQELSLFGVSNGVILNSGHCQPPVIQAIQRAAIYTSPVSCLDDDSEALSRDGA